MKKNVFGRKLKRDKNERKALFKSLMSSFILHERIETSQSKAKAIKPEIEKLITKAKKGGNSAKSVLEKSLTRQAYDKMLQDLGPRFSKRQGGYTRLIKLGKRLGDDSPMVVMELVDKKELTPVIRDKKGKKPKKKSDVKTKDVKVSKTRKTK